MEIHLKEQKYLVKIMNRNQNLNNKKKKKNPKLEFQSFLPSDSSPAYISNKPTVNVTTPLEVQTEPLMHETEFEQPLPVPEESKNYKIWNIEYYRFLFNVSSVEVLQRIGRSLIPYPTTFFDSIQPNPDLYGPFWIASTVVFLLAATGNIALYLSKVTSNQTDQWSYDVNKLSYAAAAIYGYLFLMPLFLFAVFKYNKVELKFIDLLCLYGYSFFIYIPISVLCIIPINLLRWGLVGLAGIVSTSFILTNTFTKLKGHMTKGFIILIIMAIFHIVFALSCQFYFFTY